MIYQKDWLMRQIEAMIEAIVQLLLHREKETPQMQQQTAGGTQTELREKIDGWLREGQLCKAEDWLFENMDDTDEMWLELALYLYAEMNKLTDSTLKEHDFSREEIMSGITEVCRRFGYGPLLGI